MVSISASAHHQVDGGGASDGVMIDPTTTNVIERAFELAQSGRFRSVDEITCQLGREDFLNLHAHFHGALIRQQLRERIKDASGHARRARTRRGANETPRPARYGNRR